MQTTALVLGIVGALTTFAAAGWLTFGFSPNNGRYIDDGILYPGKQRSQVLPYLMADQRKPVALSFVGAAIQLLAVLFGVLAA